MDSPRRRASDGRDLDSIARVKGWIGGTAPADTLA